MFEQLKEFYEMNKAKVQDKSSVKEDVVFAGKIPADWLEKTFPTRLTKSEITGHKCGEKKMLILIAYDIASPKRLASVAKHCEDFGLRIQYSVFECRLDADIFEKFWDGLCRRIDAEEDRVVAYRICLQCAQKVQTAGCMVTSERVVAYVF